MNTLYQIPRCPFAHRARIALNVKGIPYSTIYFESQQRPELLVGLSPDALSPTLFDEANDTWVWDSTVVAEYLEDRHPSVGLLPKDAGLRARARLAMREVDARLGSLVHPLLEEYVHKPPEARDLEHAARALPRLQRGLEAWQPRLATQSFVAGDELTLADLWLFTPLYAAAGLMGWEAVIPAQLPELRAWRERMTALPSTSY